LYLLQNLNKDPLSQSKQTFNTPLHLEVSMSSASAIKMVEDAGGTVTCVHFNALALRALMKPYKFELLPRRARPPPKIMNYYLDVTKAGYLSPEIQIRNLKLFGHTTSEEKLIEAHDNYMKAKRKLGLITYGK
jgi:large subunit ribosomal protein L15